VRIKLRFVKKGDRLLGRTEKFA